MLRWYAQSKQRFKSPANPIHTSRTKTKNKDTESVSKIKSTEFQCKVNFLHSFASNSEGAVHADTLTTFLNKPVKPCTLAQCQSKPPWPLGKTNVKLLSTCRVQEHNDLYVYANLYLVLLCVLPGCTMIHVRSCFHYREVLYSAVLWRIYPSSGLCLTLCFSLDVTGILEVAFQQDDVHQRVNTCEVSTLSIVLTVPMPHNYE